MATTLTTEHSYTGNGSTTNYSVTFTYLKEADVKVTLDHVATTAYTFANASTISFTTAPASGVAIRIFRDTDVDAARFVFSSGSALKAGELNENLDQLLYADQEKASTDNIADEAVTTAKLRDGAVTTAKFANLSITTAQLADSSVTTAKIAADAVNGTKIADNSINSEHYVDGSIDTAHIADAQVTTAKIADDAVTAAKLANTAVTAGSYTATDITVDAQGRITAASNGAIGTSEITDAAVTTAKIADANVTTAKIADNAITNAKLADAELVELATMGGNTASALADLTQAEVQILDGATVTTAELNTLDGVTATATEINQLDGKTLKASSTDFTSSIQFPSAAEIDSRITARIDPLGGFEAIADEDSFPATAPPVGTVISIANANSLAVNSSGVGAGTRAGGSDAVVINGFPSGFNSTSLDDGIGLLVIATSTAHTYDFHRVVAKNEDVRQLSSDINDFKARYRIGSSNPTTDNDAGDLFFNTGTSKMLVRNAGNSAWQEVQAVGDFFINTISSSSGTGGGSATFNGSAYRFTLSNAPITAQQLLVSINGVVQKPNSGTSQPSEGFVLNGADIIFSAAPASGAAGFFITIGSSVGIGTPSDNTVSTAKLVNDSVTNAKIADDSIDSEHYVDGSIDTAHIADSAVTSAKIADGTIVNADVNASAAIAGTKISPNFGSQNVLTTGSAGIGTTSPTSALHVSANDPAIFIQDANSTGNNVNATLQFRDSSNTQVSYFGFASASDSHLSVFNTMSGGDLRFGTASAERMRIASSGRVGIGTSSPSQLLTVAGVARFENFIEFGGSISTPGTAAAIYRPADNNLAFSTASAERLRIDSSGRLLLGTTTEGLADGNNLTIADSGPCGITLRSGSSSGGAIYFSDATSGAGEYAGFVEYLHSSDALRFATGGTERMRIDSSGNVTLGRAGTSLHFQNGFNNSTSRIQNGGGSNSSNFKFLVTNSGSESEAMRIDSSGRVKCQAGYLYVQNSASGTGDTDGLALISDGNADKYIWNYENTSLRFGTNNQERMRIDSAGLCKHYRNTTTTGVGLLQCNSDIGGTDRAQWYVLSNGDVQNRNGSYSTISSDERMKKDIVDAPSQWTDIKNIKMRKFRYKADGDDSQLQLGVIAQELEVVCPNLVTRKPATAEMSAESEGLIAEGEDLLSWKQSIVHLKALKALQEAMERIETLETQNASLEARLTALEGGS